MDGLEAKEMPAFAVSADVAPANLEADDTEEECGQSDGWVQAFP